jgi:hypothetical protein
MARPTIDTFTSNTGVSEPIALQKLEIIGESMSKTSPSPPSDLWSKRHRRRQIHEESLSLPPSDLSRNRHVIIEFV